MFELLIRIVLFSTRGVSTCYTTELDVHDYLGRFSVHMDDGLKE